MLEKICFGSSTINLRMRKNVSKLEASVDFSPYEENIFDIDSLSLLIGKNGAGKTRALYAIVERFCSRRFLSFDTDCELIFSGSLSASYQHGLKEYGVVYFTSVPHRPVMPRSLKFIDASPKRQHKTTALDLEYHQDIIRAFGIEPRLKASFRANIRQTARAMVHLLERGKYHFPPEWAPLQNELRRVKEISRSLRDLERKFESNDRDDNESLLESVQLSMEAEKKELDKARDKCLDIFLEISAERLGHKNRFATFVALEASLRRHEMPTSMLLAQILASQFGIDSKGSLHSPLRNSEKYRGLTSLITAIEEFIMVNDGQFEPGLVERFSINSDRNHVRSLINTAPLSDVIRVEWQNMSSGQWALITQLASIDDALNSLASRGMRSLLVLIDEGDVFLHLEWQREYIAQLNRMLGRAKTRLNLDCLQAIVATHSPLLATDIPKQYITRLDQGDEKSLQAFAAPLHSILNMSFNSRTMGAFASQSIRETIRNIESKKVTARDRFVISVVDDPIIRRELDRLMEENGYTS